MYYHLIYIIKENQVIGYVCATPSNHTATASLIVNSSCHFSVLQDLLLQLSSAPTSSTQSRPVSLSEADKRALK